MFLTFFQLVKIEGESMYPTLCDKERIVVLKNYHSIQKNDIIVFSTDDGYAVKRVIATPHETVALLEHSVFINGIKISPYTYDGDMDVIFELKEDQYFVIGDNYQASYDSRDYGPICAEQIVGRMFLFVTL